MDFDESPLNKAQFFWETKERGERQDDHSKRILPLLAGLTIQSEAPGGCLMEAILWHGGEAEKSREEFRKASREDRMGLVTFLESFQTGAAKKPLVREGGICYLPAPAGTP
ncbi:MAG: hypothetical protein CMN05_16340 [Roseibacillus sp.]|jgi:hypothetical protein|nr:hypothetical protein [Roseibacillus sp.]MBP36729.1 hypothetical protein [Roseibacillus sp.]MCP4729232.1 hypothetical protein [Roseibacillus sp.]MDP7308801.1 di-heme oxidoredictase family protein [Roseibacillus sp.]|tara:strand:- start:6736 stop:7068 length:333 start_codon:yes stop_codon:yes gene_type:complete